MMEVQSEDCISISSLQKQLLVNPKYRLNGQHTVVMAGTEGCSQSTVTLQSSSVEQKYVYLHSRSLLIGSKHKSVSLHAFVLTTHAEPVGIGQHNTACVLVSPHPEVWQYLVSTQSALSPHMAV